MANPKQPCAKYQYVLTPAGPQIVPVPDVPPKDEESPADYNSGGYLPIKVRDSFKDGRYTVLRKLGWGHFSTVWLVKDTHANRHSALKVVKSACRYAETARDEIKLLRQVMDANPAHPGRTHIVSFLDSFNHSGREGMLEQFKDKAEDVHVCIVFEPLGENLLGLIERNKKTGVNTNLVRLITKQVLLGLQYLHDECDLVHTDIKPENILVSIPDVESQIQVELSMSPPPASRKVGVPVHTMSRAGVAIPRVKIARERHVHIFSSQPLGSPTTHSASTSPGMRRGLAMSRLDGSGGKSATGIEMKGAKAKSIEGAELRTPELSDSSSGSSEGFGMVGSLGTAATSIGSVASGMAKLSTETSLAEEMAAAMACSCGSGDPIASSSTIPHHHQGPSLLTQTAPRNTSQKDASPPPPYSRASSPSLSPLSSLPNPHPHPHEPVRSPSPISNAPPVSIKIADLGNATPSQRHYTEDIQTRQYRSPEAILGRTDWGTTADIWSVACVVFELLTAEYLFDPQSQGDVFGKDDDHMAQIIELVGDFPPEVKYGGRFSRELFDSTGALRYIRSLKPWPLKRVMMEKYQWTAEEAAALCAFLEPMLEVDYRKRAQARDLLDHPWLEVDLADEDFVGW